MPLEGAVVGTATSGTPRAASPTKTRRGPHRPLVHNGRGWAFPCEPYLAWGQPTVDVGDGALAVPRVLAHLEGGGWFSSNGP